MVPFFTEVCFEKIGGAIFVEGAFWRGAFCREVRLRFVVEQYYFSHLFSWLQSRQFVSKVFVHRDSTTKILPPENYRLNSITCVDLLDVMFLPASVFCLVLSIGPT